MGALRHAFDSGTSDRQLLPYQIFVFFTENFTIRSAKIVSRKSSANYHHGLQILMFKGRVQRKGKNPAKLNDDALV